MKEKNTKFSWNWSAALASVYWCFYRKMIGVGIAIMAVIFAVNFAAGALTLQAYAKMKPDVYAEYEAAYSFIETVAENPEMVSTEEYAEVFWTYVTSPVNVTTAVISLATTICVAVVMGFLGNNFYKNKIVKDINSIRRVATDNTVYHIYLRQKGGVSVVNLLLPILCKSIFNMMTSFF